MNAADFIQSGLIESYCLGFTSPDENAAVEKMAAMCSEVQEEIEKTRAGLSSLLQPLISPSALVKTNIMQTVYAQQAALHKKFIPLMHQPHPFHCYYDTAAANEIEEAAEDFNNLLVKELPSTREVINLAVWARYGPEEETHTNMREYIAILEGSCDMHIGDKKMTYSCGEIISIEPNIPHHAVITSKKPMFALVQRQLF